MRADESGELFCDDMPNIGPVRFPGCASKLRQFWFLKCIILLTTARDALL